MGISGKGVYDTPFLRSLDPDSESPMKIDKLTFENHVELRLRGEFDTFYAPKLQELVDEILGEGYLFAILNLRKVRFINSTALGAIIKAYKRFKAEGGDLVIAQPSPFCKSVLNKLGIDRIVPTFETNEEAEAFLEKNMLEQDAPKVLGESRVLFSFPDEDRRARMGRHQNGHGRVLSVDHEKIRFQWNASLRDLDGQDMIALFPQGSELHVKFQVKLCKKGYFDVDAIIDEAKLEEVEGHPSVTVTAHFKELSESDRL
ncbi:MAG TPA: anti-sigma factor antagonist, partial [Planctomycetes bacterium]|nr:anti-sigma factor antagonist [Planctomycetota bacterium]